MEQVKQKLAKDILIIIVSLGLAVVVNHFGYLEIIFRFFHAWGLFGGLIAGIFFVSVFTAAPAVVILLELAQFYPPGLIALAAALGGVLGDLLIFTYTKNQLVNDFRYLLRFSVIKRVCRVFSHKAVRWILPIIGALIISSPLPDELGLLLLGLSHVKTKVFIPLSLTLNFIGIYFFILLVR